jgi:hypothetical protein
VHRDNTDNLVQDVDAAGGTISEYLTGNRIDEPLALSGAVGLHTHVTDERRTVRNLVTAAGVAVNRSTYAAFGLPRLEQLTVGNRLRYTAREWEPAAAVQYTRNRHLLPALARWTQAESLRDSGRWTSLPVIEELAHDAGDDLVAASLDEPPVTGEPIYELNMYSYVRNNPISRTDADGRGIKDMTKKGKRKRLAWCLRSCRGGTAAMCRFCRLVIAPPNVKVACWAATLVGTVACYAFCYAYFGLYR